jgi:hypothetical protein
VIVSETVESSKRVIVAVVNWTSVTVAVQIGFGHEPRGAEGATDVTVNCAGHSSVWGRGHWLQPPSW